MRRTRERVFTGAITAQAKCNAVAVGDTAIHSEHSSRPPQAALYAGTFLAVPSRDSLPVVLLQQHAEIAGFICDNFLKPQERGLYL